MPLCIQRWGIDVQLRAAGKKDDWGGMRKTNRGGWKWTGGPHTLEVFIYNKSKFPWAT